MYKNNVGVIKICYTNDKNKSYENNEINSMNNFGSSKIIRKQLTMHSPKKSYELNSKSDKEKNPVIKSTNSNRRKSVFVQSNNKNENLVCTSGKNLFKNLLNECLLNITQQANRKNIVNENNDNITKADKKFLKEYKLNYLNSKARLLRSCSLDVNFKLNKISDNKNNNKVRKSPFHKINSSEKENIKPDNPIHVSSKFNIKDEQNLKNRVVNYDDNINNSNNNMKSSAVYSKNSSLINDEMIMSLKKTISKKSSSKKIKENKINQNNYNPKKITCELNKEKFKIRPLKPNNKLKLRIKKHLSLPDQIVIKSKKKLAMPKYLRKSSIINEENIANLPFLNNNISNEDLVISSNIKEMIKNNISDFKSSSIESSIECEGVKNLKKEVCAKNAKLNKNKNMIIHKEQPSSELIENNEIKSKMSISRNNKIFNKNKKNQKINEKGNSDKNDDNNNKENLLFENCNGIKVLNEKILVDNTSVHTNNSINSPMNNDNFNSQISFLNKSNQKSNISLSEINESNKEKINNKALLRKVNTVASMNNKSLMKLEVFRELERKNIIYDSLDDDETDEFDENFLCLNPNSFCVIMLDVYIAFSTIFYMIMIPLSLASNRQFCINSIFSFKNFLIYMNDVIFFIDVIMGFFKKYYDFEEQLINDHSTIINHYLKGNFVLDLISAIPLLSIKILTTTKCSINNIIEFSHKYYDCKLNNLSDLWKLVKIIKIAKILNDNVFLKYLNKCIDDFDANGKIITLLTYMIVAIPSLHFATCLNIFISRNAYPNWINSLNVQNESFSKIYLTSLYHIITSVTTVGYGDITPSSFTETIFQLIILLIGIVAYSWLVSSVSNYIKTSNEKYIEYENKLRILDDIKLKNPKMPNNLYQKIMRHLNYGKKKLKKDNHIIFEILPYSLKNSLIYEMYKPIINNFTIFKNSQNSDFILSTIMAFKPFSAGKNDLIVKFGDIFEEMIFVKKGKLSIEICINKRYQTQVIEAYLNDPLLHDEKLFHTIQKKRRDSSIILNNLSSSILNHGYSNIMKYSSIFPFKMESNSTNKVSTFELEDLKSNKTNDIQNEINLRILDIRQNEYFGDILMFLGYKSPFNIKVKSKEAELFLLRKVDAINISLTYKNIWNRINEKSTFNIEEIKLQIQKVVKQYCQYLGIKVNNKKNTASIININNKKKKLSKSISPNSLQSSITGESNNDNSINFTKYFNSAVSNSQRVKGSQNTICSIINKIDDKEDKNNKNVKKSNFANNKNDKIEKLKNSSSLNFESFSLKEKETSNVIEDFKKSNLFKLSNKFYENADIKSNEEKNETKFITAAYTLGKYESNASNNAKYSNYQYSNHNNDENNLTPFKPEEINDEIYPGEIFEVEIIKNFDDSKNLMSCVKLNKNYSSIVNDDLNKNSDQKIKIKESGSIEEKHNITKVKFSNNILTEAKNFSLEYKSTYENLNQFTKYQYSKDIDLQIQTKIFLEDICFNKGIIKNGESSNSINTKKTKRLNNATNDIKNIKNFFNDDSSPINNRLINTKISSNLIQSSTNNICTIKINSNDNNNSNTPKNINDSSRYSKKRKSTMCISTRKLEKVNNNDSTLSLKKRKTFRKSCQKFSLFAKSSIQNNNNSSMSSNKKPRKTSKPNKLLNMVNKNIIQDSQNINNPEMFYSDLFSSLMKKEKRSSLPENKVSDNGNDHDLTSEDQNCELSFINNKENTFSRFNFSPIKIKHGELSPNPRKNRNKKKSVKVNA